MKIGATTEVLGRHVHRELDGARLAALAGESPEAWHFLERAHILAQPSATLHTRVHCSMLSVALRLLDAAR